MISGKGSIGDVRDGDSRNGVGDDACFVGGDGWCKWDYR